MNEIKMLMSEIKLIKQSIVAMEKSLLSIEEWLPEKVVMRFFNYGKTQMRSLEKRENIIISKIGNRKFYNKHSIIDLVEKNISKC